MKKIDFEGKNPWTVACQPKASKNVFFWLILIQFSSIWLIWFSFSIILFSKNYNIHYPTNLSKSWPAQKLEKWLEKACWLTPNPPHWCPPVRTGPTGLTWVPKHETAKWHSKTANCAKKIRNKTWPRALITPDPGKTDKQIWPIFGLWKTRPVQPPLGGGVLECRKMHKNANFENKNETHPPPPPHGLNVWRKSHQKVSWRGRIKEEQRQELISIFTRLGGKGGHEGTAKASLDSLENPTQHLRYPANVRDASCSLCNPVHKNSVLQSSKPDSPGPLQVPAHFLRLFYGFGWSRPLKSGKSIGGPTSTSGHIREIKTEWM